MDAIRLKQSNLIGPAGMISMEDGEAVEIVQQAVSSDRKARSYIAMGGGGADDADHLVTEGAIIGFWQNYREMVGIEERVSRSEERRVGKEGVSKCRIRWEPEHKKKKKR